jgi:prepilin-type N-terminal cleavage/methylation domain-containing protein
VDNRDVAAAPPDRPPVLRDEAGFTLLELVVVMIVIGVLLAVAFPSYVGFRARAVQSTARANVRQVLPAVEAFRADNGSYDGMTLKLLKSRYQLSIDVSPDSPYRLTHVSESSYCLQYGDEEVFAYKRGPGADIVVASSSGC